jgi:hypothetical protein
MTIGPGDFGTNSPLTQFHVQYMIPVAFQGSEHVQDVVIVKRAVLDLHTTYIIWLDKKTKNTTLYLRSRPPMNFRINVRTD